MGLVRAGNCRHVMDAVDTMAAGWPSKADCTTVNPRAGWQLRRAFGLDVPMDGVNWIRNGLAVFGISLKRSGVTVLGMSS